MPQRSFRFTNVWRVKRPGPAAVFFYYLVNLGHQTDGLVNGDDYFVIVHDILIREDSPFAVFEPSFGYLTPQMPILL